MGLEYVDIFYSHRPDPDTPLEETMGALHTAVTSGQGACTSASRTTRPSRPARPPASCGELGTPLLIHQPSYSMFNRHSSCREGERDLLDAARRARRRDASSSRRWRRGCSPSATCRRHPGGLAGAARVASSSRSDLRDLPRACPGPGRDRQGRAASRSPSSPSPGCCATRRVTSALIGASSVAQLEDNVAALAAPPLTDDELAAIEEHAVDGTGR